MKLSEIANIETIDIEIPVSERSRKYVYFDKSKGLYDVKIPKANVRVSFASNKLKEALDYRDFVLKALDDKNFDMSKLIKPSEEYRGIRKKSKNVKNRFEIFEVNNIHNDSHYLLIDSKSDFELDFKSKEIAHQYCDLYNVAELNSTSVGQTLRTSDLRKPSLFERGRFDDLTEEELKIVKQQLVLLKKLYNNLKAPNNTSGERYVVKDDDSHYSGWNVLIKIGKRVLCDKRAQILREAIEIRDRVVKELKKQLEFEILTALVQHDIKKSEGDV